MGRLSSAILVFSLLVTTPVGRTVPAHAEDGPNAAKILGGWKVISLRGVVDLSVDDLVEFTDDGQLVTYFRRPLDGRQTLHQSFELNGRRLKVASGGIDVDFRIHGNSLRLTTADGFVDVLLHRAGEVIVG